MLNAGYFKDIAKRCRKNIIKDCIDIIGIPSVSNNREMVKKALRFVIKRAIDMGFTAYTVLDDKIGVIEYGKGEKTIGILVHVDVVDAGNESLWKTPPFEGTLKDGCIFGRGAVDDKCPLISVLYALNILKNSGEPVCKKIQIIIGTQEEVEWNDIDEYKEKYKLPDYGFTPDDGFPIINSEKGYADVVLHFKNTVCTIGKFEVTSFKAGESLNSVPASAEISLKNLNDKSTVKISAGGISVHSSIPQNGVNAIYALCSILESVSLSDDGISSLVSFVNKKLADDIYGKSFGFYTEDEQKRTTVCPTLCEKKENGYEMNINIRNDIGVKKQDIIDSFRESQKIFNYDFYVSSYLEPFYVKNEEKFLSNMAKSYEEVTGFKSYFKTSSGTTYAKSFPNMVAFGPVFPSEHDFCHELNERITVDNVLNETAIYSYFLYLDTRYSR